MPATAPTRWLMPAEAYTDRAWYEREQRDLHWSCAEQLRAGHERSRPTLSPIAPLSDDEARPLRANLLWPNVPMTTSSTTVKHVPGGAHRPDHV